MMSSDRSPLMDGEAADEGADHNDGVQLARQTSGTVADRVKRLQAEARFLAFEEIQAFENQLLMIADTAETIATGGDSYPVGVRGIAQQYAEELRSRVQSLRAITQRLADAPGIHGGLPWRRPEQGLESQPF